MSDTMKDLIARIEAASGPDRKLDAEIALMGKCPNWRELAPWKKTNGWAKPGDPQDAWSCLQYDSGGNSLPYPAFTGSLNDALSLVPEGMRCRLDILEDGRGAAWVYAPGDIADTWAEKRATPALAICTAALKARMA